ncbi:hypothetical protein AC482_05830 [miscellaneous Crenarchaeota group-15 archaeon DG-45]|uniref:Uncharacterized protein n=1 Tax=miscellaneous Crenarchaeota group-15 archaeon DG-45 TaxID=1685127 RepID=A0A0M0BMB5_9ARCH|nr:MAG: hypothetical protein AC482_05830 [miscellaneous Crenarchaeota group-15 archaeon DG-45]
MTAELDRSPLWLILVEVVHALPMYPSHKAYVRDRLIIESPDISAEELSLRLDIPLGEAMVILSEIAKEEAEGGENPEEPRGPAPT